MGQQQLRKGVTPKNGYLKESVTCSFCIEAQQVEIKKIFTLEKSTLIVRNKWVMDCQSRDL